MSASDETILALQDTFCEVTIGVSGAEAAEVVSGCLFIRLALARFRRSLL